MNKFLSGFVLFLMLSACGDQNLRSSSIVKSSVQDILGDWTGPGLLKIGYGISGARQKLEVSGFKAVCPNCRYDVAELEYRRNDYDDFWKVETESFSQEFYSSREELTMMCWGGKTAEFSVQNDKLTVNIASFKPYLRAGIYSDSCATVRTVLQSFAYRRL